MFLNQAQGCMWWLHRCHRPSQCFTVDIVICQFSMTFQPYVRNVTFIATIFYSVNPMDHVMHPPQTESKLQRGDVNYTSAVVKILLSKGHMWSFLSLRAEMLNSAFCWKTSALLLAKKWDRGTKSSCAFLKSFFYLFISWNKCILKPT